jgi:predicted porin
MRKLLLAGVAVVGSMGLANAQTTTTNTTTTAPLPMGVMGMPAAPSTYLGGNNAINQDGGPMSAGASNPTPGSMVIHLNGRIWAYAGFGGGSGYVYSASPGEPAAKLNPMQWIGYMRLYPGMDAMATNGLRYGAISEIRQNFIGQGYGSTTAGLNGAGANYSTSPSGSSCASTLYFRREAIYIGSNDVGILRVGQDDGPTSQFDNGVTTWQFGTGAWNGDAPDNIPGNAQPTFPFWSGIGATYTVSKAAYFSPRFAGFDFGASYAPNNGPNNASACAVAAAGCDALSSNNTGAFGGAGRPTNWFEVAGRYQGTYGPVGLYGLAAYDVSGNVKSTVPASEQFHGFSVGDFGLVATIAGFSFGGNVQWGDYNNQVALEPKGGNAEAAVAWVLGAQYTQGPWYVAGSYYNYQYTGAWSGSSVPGLAIGQRYDDAFAAGAGYTLAPGLNLYVEYLYSQSHQGNVNLLAGTTGSTANNNVHIQSLVIGTRVQW